MMNRRSTRTRLFLLAGAAALAAVFAREPIAHYFAPSPAPSIPDVTAVPAKPAQSDISEQALAHIESTLAWADLESDRVLAQHLQAVDAFFGDVKKRTPAFSKKILGWSSKWRLVADKMPYTRTDRHSEFIRNTFNAELFTPRQLRQATEQVTRDYVDSLAGIENVMLVRLRADMTDLSPSALPAFESDARLRAAYESALMDVQMKVRAELKADLSRETTSLISSEVLTLVAVRMGVSAGILSVGAGTSWATLGIGLAVGVIVDQAVTWVWDWYRDPVGDLSGKINGKLDLIHETIVQGDGIHPGLQGKLAELSKQRSTVRRAAIRQMILGQHEQLARAAMP